MRGGKTIARLHARLVDLLAEDSQTLSIPYSVKLRGPVQISIRVTPTSAILDGPGISSSPPVSVRSFRALL